MSSRTKFVCGGGWVERQVFGRPKLRAFAALAFGWSAISVVALWMIFLEQAGAGLSGFALLCASLALPQPVFVALAIAYWITEEPRSWTERVPNPEYDVRNLY